MSFRVVRLNASTYPVDPVERAELAKANAELIEVEQPQDNPQAIASCDALLVVSAYVRADLMERLLNCRTIARLGAGTDRIDILAATQCGIVVSNVPDFCLSEQADHTMTLLLAFARRLPYMMDAMKLGNWTARGHQGVHRIAGQTLGMIGFGNSAREVARRAAGFGLRLLAWARNPAKHQATADQCGVQLVSVEDLLSRSDFISLHLPLTAETRHFISAERLQLLKPNAALINTSRGAIVDEAALIELLRTKKIAGAALDVFGTIDVFAPPGQPPKHPLLELDNVIATPHCAGSSVESTFESKQRGARHAAQVLLDHWPDHVVNPEVQPRQPLTRE